MPSVARLRPPARPGICCSMGAAGGATPVVVTSTLFSSALQISPHDATTLFLCASPSSMLDVGEGLRQQKVSLANHNHLSNGSFSHVATVPPSLLRLTFRNEGRGHTNFDLISKYVFSFGLVWRPTSDGYSNSSNQLYPLYLLPNLRCRSTSAAFGPSHDSQSRCSQRGSYVRV